MDLLHAIILALIQGFSEFLPISSSAHLILLPKINNWQDQGLAFDVVVHLGTLTAVAGYFRKDISTIINDFINSIALKKEFGDSKLAWGVILGTIPVGLIGLIFKDIIETDFRNLEVIAYTTIIFGLLLWFADWVNNNNKSPREHINWVDVIVISSFQAIALIPGTSRSGITITAGFLLGLSKYAAVRFSFLLSIPVIILSSTLIIIDLYKIGDNANWYFLILAFLISSISAYLTIALFIKLLDKVGILPFVIYRLILGIILLIL